MSSIDIVVLRGEGDKVGTDIEDPLACTIEVALARGRNELDANSGLQSIATSCSLRGTLVPGMLVEVQDALQGETRRGKIKGVRHIVSAPSVEAITELDLEA